MEIRSAGTSSVFITRLIALFVALGFLAYSTDARKYEQTFSLGGQKIHEKLGYFKTVFPGSACGTPLDYEHINRHTLDDPDHSGWLTCCIDEPREVSRFSQFTILSVDDNCPVLVSFYREHLHDIRFRLNVSSVEQVLPGFVEAYGPVHQFKTLSARPIPVRLAMWIYDDVFELTEELVSEFDPRPNPTLQNKPRDAKIVLVDMYELGW